MWLILLALFLAIAAVPWVLPWLVIKLYLNNLRLRNRYCRSVILKELGHDSNDGRKKIVGYFHPYCNAGGGGERVLWTAIAANQRVDSETIHVVYSGDLDATKDEIISKVKTRFNIILDPTRLHFVFLHSRKFVEDVTWPRFTLLGQSIGSMYLAWEAMTKLIPDLYIDSMGYAFTFHVVAFLAQVPIGAYVHYPTISTDMLARVQGRQAGVTNDDFISSSAFLTWGKLLYYRFFLYYYANSLRKASFIMVNSTWTKNHVDAILQHSDPLLTFSHLTSIALWPIYFFSRPLSTSNQARIVYPPCNTQDMQHFPLENRERIILSVAQFRPEKDHTAQLHSFHKLLELHPELSSSKEPVKLVLIGGCRNAGDQARLDQLKALSELLQIGQYTEFIVNAPFSTVLSYLSKASIGLSTMVDEHFGINIVEFMAAGVIPVTHASGGPLQDIVVPWKGEHTGYHAKSPEGFAEAMYKVLTLSSQEDVAIRQRAREAAISKFSEIEFEKGWEESGWRNYIL
ncbi:mannosyltransferase [Pluteus cervinus]|uniref:Mannosyltransferase n=1 Tax=Pluteus cervinus TaxID=181527 RepID=A0ACD3AYF3_9AGAR|nr:mannosyltransferase [Pluteus cervinus]